MYYSPEQHLSLLRLTEKVDVYQLGGVATDCSPFEGWPDIPSAIIIGHRPHHDTVDDRFDTANPKVTIFIKSWYEVPT